MKRTTKQKIFGGFLTAGVILNGLYALFAFQDFFIAILSIIVAMLFLTDDLLFPN